MSSRVQVSQGKLQGKLCTGFNDVKYHSFEGIPYAKPPVGNLRFKDPQGPENWTGVRDATKPGNKCAQMNGRGSVEGSEDCLYLNVYTPSLPDEKIKKLPVIFFVHGGRLLMGYGDYYQPDYFIRHNVILVTINYRLHALGFLCLNTPEVPGNAGLKDTIMALKWVKNNVINFNGDPNNVTAFGESAGAAAIATYLTSKMADGLCHKIIAESGNSISDLFIIEEDSIPKAKNLATILGKEDQDEKQLYDFLMNVPVEDLVTAVITAESSKPSYVLKGIFLPVAEKRFDGVESFLEQYPIVDIRRNNFKKLPFIAGLNSHEGALFLRKDKKGNIIYEKDLSNFIPFSFLYKPDDPKVVEFAKRANEFYFKNKEINDSVKKEYVDFISDAYLNRIDVYFAELMSKYSNDFYFFNFAYSGGMNTRVMNSLGMKGACHSDILQYQFYRKGKAKKCNENDNKIVDFLSETWCNFAKNGKPTWTNQEIEWLPYKSSERNYLNIDVRITLQKDLFRERFNFWRSYMEEKAKL